MESCTCVNGARLCRVCTLIIYDRERLALAVAVARRAARLARRAA